MRHMLELKIRSIVICEEHDKRSYQLLVKLYTNYNICGIE